MSKLIERVAQAFQNRQNIDLSDILAWQDGDGQREWDECRDAQELLRLVAYVDHGAAVAAAVACAATALRLVTADAYYLRARRSLMTVLSWLAGIASEHDVHEASTVDAVFSPAETAAYASAYSVTFASYSTELSVLHAEMSAEFAAEAIGAAHARSLVVLADVVRAIVRCPTSGELVEAAERNAR